MFDKNAVAIIIEEKKYRDHFTNKDGYKTTVISLIPTYKHLAGI